MKAISAMTGSRNDKATETDSELVRRFAGHDDGEAFSILMRRYVDMVYTTCWRILGDEALAADAVQETFFQLVKDANRITGSLGGWLHRVATRRSVDFIRQNVSRRNREQSYARDADHSSNTWAELEPAVDEALEELPDHLREVLILHFLQGRSTLRIAADRGISQPTISRRLADALEMLREKLAQRGLPAAALPVQAVLLHSNQVAPEAVRMSLGKIALIKAAGAQTLFFGPTTAKVAMLAVCAALLMISMLWVMPARATKQKSRVAAPVADAVPPPAPADKAVLESKVTETVAADLPGMTPTPIPPVEQPPKPIPPIVQPTPKPEPTKNPPPVIAGSPSVSVPTYSSRGKGSPPAFARPTVPIYLDGFIDRDNVRENFLKTRTGTSEGSQTNRVATDNALPAPSPGRVSGAFAPVRGSAPAPSLGGARRKINGSQEKAVPL